MPGPGNSKCEDPEVGQRRWAWRAVCLSEQEGDAQFWGASTSAVWERGLECPSEKSPHTHQPPCSTPGILPKPSSLAQSQNPGPPGCGVYTAPPGGALQPQLHHPGLGSWVLPLLRSILCQGPFQGPWRTTRQTSEQETDSGHLCLGDELLSKNISCITLGKVLGKFCFLVGEVNIDVRG